MDSDHQPGNAIRLADALRTLENTEQVSYVLDLSLNLAYHNKAWDKFARENSAPELAGGAAIGMNLLAVTVMQAFGWSEAKKRAYLIADNKLAENASWDRALLSLEIAELRALDFDPSLAGFSIKELDDLSSVAPVEFPAIPENVKTDYCCPKCGYRWSGREESDLVQGS